MVTTTAVMMVVVTTTAVVVALVSSSHCGPADPKGTAAIDEAFGGPAGPKKAAVSTVHAFSPFPYIIGQTIFCSL
jgi:hypothetical protein